MTHPRTILALMLLLATVSFGCAAKPTASASVPAEPAPLSAPAAAEPPVTVSGKGVESSKPFHLGGGNYLVAWSATNEARSDGRPSSCHAATHLDSIKDPSVFSKLVMNEVVKDGTAEMSGETSMYRIPAGEFYMRGTGSCLMTVTITPQ